MRRRRHFAHPVWRVAGALLALVGGAIAVASLAAVISGDGAGYLLLTVAALLPAAAGVRCLRMGVRVTDEEVVLVNLLSTHRWPRRRIVGVAVDRGRAHEVELVLGDSNRHGVTALLALRPGGLAGDARSRRVGEALQAQLGER